jgi:cob(I)alamin adenosyltransferase
MRKGYIQVYTGNGKGKTTAAFGLALRAAGAGLRVFIAQFIKKRRCSEHGLILKRKTTQSDMNAAQKGLAKIRKVIDSNEYDVVILDEVNVAVRYDLISLADLLDIIESKPEGVELVITGRYADERVIEKADLVTEMKEIKHYKEQGIKARRGIEC